MRSLEGAKGKRAKFDRTRVFVGDRVKMCHLRGQAGVSATRKHGL